MPAKESTIERAILAEVKRRGGVALKLQGAGNRGYPDRLVVLPGGKICFLEIKRKEAAADQKLQHQRLRELAGLGVVAARVWSVNQAIETMERL